AVCGGTRATRAHRGSLRRDNGGGVSQPHLALVAGCRLTLDTLAHNGPARREHRGGVSQPHVALVAGCRVTLDTLAHNGPARRDHRGGVSQPHLALAAGCRVTLDPLAHNGPARFQHRGRGAHPGRDSPSRTLPWLRVAASRSTLSPITGRRAFTISCMECLLFMKVPFLVPAQPKSIGTECLLDSGLGAAGARYWDGPG